MKYKELKQHVARLEAIAEATIEMPTKAEWKALSADEQNEALSDLIGQSFALITEDALEGIRATAEAEFDEEKKKSVSDHEPTPPTSGIDSILAERGSNYGKFSDHAHLAQTLKSIFDSHVRQYGQPELFTDTMNEAIEMVFHKLARIGNGNPTYVDSWTDIIGYTQLVIDELEGGESR